MSKKNKGLYRVARTSSTFKQTNSTYYSEIKIDETFGEGGICIGVIPNEAPLNKVIGTGNLQVGLHSAGKVVACDEWSEANMMYGRGDIISTLLDVNGVEDAGSPISTEGDESSEANARRKRCRVWFFVNGEMACDEDGVIIDSRNCGLYVGVSLYRLGSQVTLRCCNDEWEHFNNIVSQQQKNKKCIRSFCHSTSPTNNMPDDNCCNVNNSLTSTHVLDQVTP